MLSTSTTKTGCVSDPPDASLFPLLELPRDLRDHIYIAILYSSAPPPSFPVTSIEDRVPGGTLAREDGAEFFEYCNMYHRFPLPTTTSALLTLNRQVHTEVKALMSRKQTKRPLIYKLDCMMVDERRLYPTWLSIPALSSNVDVVETNIRLFGDVKGGRSYWTPGDGGPGSMIWSLLGLLNRFVKRGPDFLSPPKLTGVKIGELVVNVVEPEGFIPVEPHFAGSRRTKSEGLIHPETVAYQIERGILQLLCHDEGKRARESLGIIRLCLAGEEFQTWNVNERICRRIHQVFHQREENDPGSSLKRRMSMREVANKINIPRILLKAMKRRLYSR